VLVGAKTSASTARRADAAGVSPNA
jgi:hypothetical protein